MTNKILEGMARAAWNEDGCAGDYDKNLPEIRAALAEDMRRALLWLADNVSDEMMFAAYDRHKKSYRPDQTTMRLAMAAAIRSAAGESK